MKIAFFILSIFFCLASAAQESHELIFKLDGAVDQLYKDQLENIYTVKGDNVRKYLPDGKLQYEISPKRNGVLTFADFNDPLRPMLYYRDLGLIQVLDNTLSEQGGPVDLFNTFESSIWLACLSIDNHFWFYDTDNFEFFRTDRNFVKISRSGNLVPILGRTIMPEWMIERNSILYVSDPQQGIFMFDLFGTYIKKLPLEGLQKFQIVKGEVVFSRPGEICVYQPLLFTESCMEISKDAEYTLLGKDRLIMKTKSGIQVRKR